MGSAVKFIPGVAARTPTASELRAAVQAMSAAGYSLVEQHHEAQMWESRLHLWDAEGNVVSHLTVDARLTHEEGDELASYYCFGTCDAQRLLSLEIARLAGPQITLAADGFSAQVPERPSMTMELQ